MIKIRLAPLALAVLFSGCSLLGFVEDAKDAVKSYVFPANPSYIGQDYADSGVMKNAQIPLAVSPNAYTGQVHYTWTCSTGSFAGATDVSSVEWIAPDVYCFGSNEAAVTVSMTDDGAGSSSYTFSIPVGVVSMPYTIDASTTLEGDNVFLFENNTTVTGATLTVEAGAILKFGNACELYIDSDAAITATGTALSPVVFTSLHDDTGIETDDSSVAPAMFDWDGVYVTGSSCTFDACTFLYADIALESYYVSGLTVTDCVFAQNAYGLDTGASLDTAASHVITGNLFYSNLYPLVISAQHDLDASNSFSTTIDTVTYRNDVQRIFVENYTISGAANHVDWSVTEVAYWLASDLSITGGGLLTLADGVALKFGPNETMYVDSLGGNLSLGADAVMTVWTDDRYPAAGDAEGRDSNNDSTLTNYDSMSWEGIWDYALDSGNGDWATSPAVLQYSH